MLRRVQNSSTLRFTAPVIIENIATTVVGLVFSSIIGGISATSLAGISVVNAAMAVLTALSSLVVTGSSVLVARLVGEDNQRETSIAVEQTIFLSIVFSLIVTFLCEIGSVPLTRLLLPGTDSATFNEGLTYCRTLMLSFPFLILYNALGGVLRASGESGPAMLSALLLNVVQIIASALLISVWHLGVVGAGLAFVICRLFGAALMFYYCLTNHRHFHIRLKGVIRPIKSMLTRILRIGIPVSIEQVTVQACYVLVNSMLVMLGNVEASAYQICNALIAFANLPQVIGGVVGVTMVGQALGAGDTNLARRSHRRLLYSGLAVSTVLGFLLALLSTYVVPLYTKDPVIQKRAIELLWAWQIFYPGALYINVNDPVLRSGGEAKVVMINNVVCVPLIRPVLSYLLCFVFDFGAMGMLIANPVTCTVRAAIGAWCIHRGKWLYKKV